MEVNRQSDFPDLVIAFAVVCTVAVQNLAFHSWSDWRARSASSSKALVFSYSYS